MAIRLSFVSAVGAIMPLMCIASAATGTITAYSNSGPVTDSDMGDFLTFSASARSADAFSTPGFGGPGSINSLSTNGRSRVVHGGMRAFARANSSGSHSFASISTSTGGSFLDLVTISTTLPITQGTFAALIWMSGSVSLNEPGLATAHASFGVESSLGSDTATISLTPSDPFASGFQLIQIPIVFGETFQVFGEVSLSVLAGSDFLLGGSLAVADFSSTANWGGITEVRDNEGNLIEDWQINSSSGQDYRDEIVPPEIPGPGAWSAAGLAVGAGLLRRRR